METYKVFSTAQTCPVVIDSPHSGDIIPEDIFGQMNQSAMRRWQDNYVDELVASAPQQGIPLLCSTIHRGFIDVNCHQRNVDASMIKGADESQLQPTPQTLTTGNGLFKRFGPNGERLTDNDITYQDMQRLILTYYLPYHDRLSDMISQTRDIFGKAIHLNMHAMLSTNRDGSERPDFIISDAHGTTCKPELIEFLKKTMEEFGYSVAVNEPFDGGELIRHFGQPKLSVHSVQIEIKKGLYMNENTFEKHEGFASLQSFMRELFKRLNNWARVSV